MGNENSENEHEACLPMAGLPHLNSRRLGTCRGHLCGVVNDERAVLRVR